ncbi:MAG TPA: hypothetical protein VM659_03075 [Dongiaceae bacterium]|nr:hypothetical protein [Dongiaceae bacterium]
MQAKLGCDGDEGGDNAKTKGERNQVSAEPVTKRGNEKSSQQPARQKR